MRVFDIIFSLLGLLFLSPIFVIVVFVLRFTGEGEVFFIQSRVGHCGKKFGIVKFATMLKDSPNLGSGTITSKDDPRILPIGRILRKTKINELPQLYNILIGDMSIIGPRPHAPRDLEGVSKDVLKDVLTLKPGLSGIASIIFRNEEEIMQKFESPRVLYDTLIAPYKAELELWYFKNSSLRLYFFLIFATCISVISGRSDFIFKLLPSLPKPTNDVATLLNL